MSIHSNSYNLFGSSCIFKNLIGVSKVTIKLRYLIPFFTIGILMGIRSRWLKALIILTFPFSLKIGALGD